MVHTEALFLPREEGGQCFGLLTRPAGASRGAVLFFPPFAEELNKSRRMVALAARCLAGQGWSVLQVDPLGCGDSSGEFGDAGWQAWLADMHTAWAWLQREQAPAFNVLWGLRAGALLVSDFARQYAVSAPWLLWQPVANGKQHLHQFLRMKGVGGMLDASDAAAVMTRLREQMAAGETVEVAGYDLAPALVSGLEQAALQFDVAKPPVLQLLEVAPGAEACSPAVQGLLKRALDAGVSATAQAIAGPSFWQAQEIEQCAELVDVTVATLEAWHGRA